MNKYYLLFVLLLGALLAWLYQVELRGYDYFYSKFPVKRP